MRRLMTYINSSKGRRHFGLFSLLFILSFSHFLLSCESIDCTLNNVVTCNYAFYGAEGDAVVISDTMTITAEGTDSILFNRGTNVGTFKLPMSYWQEADTLHFSFRSGTRDFELRMSLCVRKSNRQHFESPDCPTTIFHELESVQYETNASFIDSVIIVNKAVNFDAKENIRIYLHTAD